MIDNASEYYICEEPGVKIILQDEGRDYFSCLPKC